MTDIVERLLSHPDDINPMLKQEAAAEIKRLRASLTQFVAACETAPPTSLMIEIGMACKVAKRALALSSHNRGIENG